MQYQIGQTGRVVVARLSEGEDLYESIEAIARKEDIRAAAVLITGGIRKADVVVGPKTEIPNIEPDFKRFTGPGEVLGIGTLYWDEEKPILHIHTAMGKGEAITVGCPRGGAEIFLILEVTIIELKGITATRKLDAETQFKLLDLS